MRQFYLLLVLAMGLGCATTPGKAPPTREDLKKEVDQARKSLASQKYEEARTQAGKALNINAKYDPAIRVQAVADLALNDVSGAREKYGRLVESDYKNPEYRVDLGVVLVLLGQPEDGFAEFSNALEINPIYFPAFYNLGVLGSFLEKVDQSEAYYWKALELKPGHEGTKLALLRLYLSKKSDEAVVELLRKWKGEKNLVLPSHQFYMNKKQPTSAARVLLVGLEKQGMDFDMNFRLGCTLLELDGMLSQAIAALERAKTANGEHPGCRLILGKAYLQAAEDDERMYYWAYTNFEKLSQIDGANAESWFYLGLASQRTGRIKKALSAYRKSLQIDPKFTSSRNNLIAIYLQNGNYLRSIEMLEKAGVDSPVLLFNLGHAYHLSGKKRVSQSFYREATNRGNSDSDFTELAKKIEKGRE